MLTANGSICVVEWKDGNVDAHVHKNRYEMVFHAISDARIGDGRWASDKHIAALSALEGEIRRTINKLFEAQRSIE